MSDPQLGRIRFRAWRRGFREADLILGPFADSRAGDLSSADLDRFERLLEQNDHDLYGWVLGSIPVPAEFDHGLMAALREFARAACQPASHGG